MRVVITGGAGFIGRRLALRLLELNALTDAAGVERPIERILLFDRAAPDPSLLHDPRVEAMIGDIGDAEQVAAAIAPDTGAVFHLAAVVSAGAEEDFDLGMTVNLAGTMNVLAAARRLPAPARLVFSSSVAVYGGAMPERIPDGLMLNPQTSYGAQKAIGELLVQDYARKGYVDGRALRFPDDRGAPRQAQQGGLHLGQLHHPRAAAGRGGGLPGRAGAGDVCALAAQGGGGGAEGGRAAGRGLGAGADAGPAGADGDGRRDAGRAPPGRRRARRGAGALRAGPLHPGDRKRLGDAFRTRRAGRRSASRPTATSRKSCASSSRTSSAASSPDERAGRQERSRDGAGRAV